MREMQNTGTDDSILWPSVLSCTRSHVCGVQTAEQIKILLGVETWGPIVLDGAKFPPQIRCGLHQLTFVTFTGLASEVHSQVFATDIALVRNTLIHSACVDQCKRQSSNMPHGNFV